MAKSGSGLKILLVVLGVILFLGALSFGAVWHGWHKVKRTVASKGFDLDRLTQVQSGPERQIGACELLTKEDLAQILSLPIDRAESSGRSSHSTCNYYSAAAAQHGADQVASGFKKMQDDMKEGNSPAQQEAGLKDLETMLRGVASGAAGLTHGPVLSIEVNSENSRAAMAGFRLGVNIGASVVAKDAKPEARTAMAEEVKGVGDEAVFGPLKTLFMFRKGDVSVKLDARMLPGGRDTEIAIAQRILARL
jgi:hypothetical protein